jgi:hypothetical protein
MQIKHKTICLLIVFVAITSQAQNLQFGKTKLIGSKTDTVPTGKVWKVETIIYRQGIVTCPTSGISINISDSITLDGTKMMVRAQRFSGLYENTTYRFAHAPEFLVWEQKLPMWLPAGTTLSAGRGVFYLSVLEFNDVP